MISGIVWRIWCLSTEVDEGDLIYQGLEWKNSCWITIFIVLHSTSVYEIERIEVVSISSPRLINPNIGSYEFIFKLYFLDNQRIIFRMLWVFKKFAIQGNGNDWKRCFVIDICWFHGGIGVNTLRLFLLFNKSKNAMKFNFQNVKFCPQTHIKKTHQKQRNCFNFLP